MTTSLDAYLSVADLLLERPETVSKWSIPVRVEIVDGVEGPELESEYPPRAAVKWAKTNATTLSAFLHLATSSRPEGATRRFVRAHGALGLLAGGLPSEATGPYPGTVRERV